MPVITPQFEITATNANGVYRIPAVKRIRVTSSRELKADTAKISLPMMRGLDLNTFRKSDEVNIKFGHREDSSMKTVFLGYVTKLGPNEPVVVECEDIWSQIKNRQRSSNHNYKSKSYSEIAGDLIGDIKDVEGIGIMAPDSSKVMDDNFHVERQSYGQLFNWLIKNSGWGFFVVPGTKMFYFGPGLYNFSHKQQLETPVFRRGLNIVRSNLKWREGGDYGGVTVFTSDKDFKNRVENARGEYVDPDAGSSPKMKDMFVVGIKGKEAGDERAKEEYDRLNANGFEGRLRTFGQSGLTHSMECRIDGVDHRHPQAHEKIKKIVYEYGPDIGFKMEVYLDPAMSVGAN